MKTFTRQFVRDNSGCYLNEKGIDFINALDFMNVGDETTPIPYTWILESSIPTKDKYWFFCKKVFSKEQNQAIAIEIASIVLEIFETKFPNDDRPRKAIQAAQDYLDGTIDRQALLIARNNAAAAYVVAATDAYDGAAYAAAATAADDAAAAADDAAADGAAAAEAAYYAATAAAYAAAYDAAYDAYGDAAYDAYAAPLREALMNYLTIFCQENL